MEFKGNIVVCIKANDDIKQYLTNTYNDSLIIKELRPPAPNQVKEVQELLGVIDNYELSKVGNHVYKILAPCRYNLKGVAERLCKCIDILKATGKSENALVSVYYKFLCWMKFELNSVLKGESKTKIQYWGTPTPYEVMVLYIALGVVDSVVIASENCIDDVILNDLGIVYNTDGTPLEGILKPAQPQSIKLDMNKVKRDFKVPKADYVIGTNMWIKGDNLDDIFVKLEDRKIEDVSGFVTKSAFIKVNGVDDKVTYLNELYNLYLKDRNFTVLVNSDFRDITPNDISALRQQHSNADFTQYLLSLCSSLNLDKLYYSVLANEFLKKMNEVEKNKEAFMLKVFFIIKDILQGRSCNNHYNLFFLQTNAVTEVQSVVLYLLSCLMFDVVVFNPRNIDLGMPLDRAYVMNYDNTLDISEFPTSANDLVIETTAFSAENELTDMLYNGSAGIYRDNQFKFAISARLKPMCEEIDLLWDKEVKLRQGFTVNDGVVTIPCIFAEVLGVQKGNIQKWTKRLDSLIEDKSLVLYNQEKPFMSFCEHTLHSGEVIRGKVINKYMLKENPKYPYSYLSIDRQNYMIDKLQELLDSNVIKGVYNHGVENDVLSVFVSLDTINGLVRLIQNFDFTGNNPKVVYTWLSKEKIPLNDIILLNYLSILGFDVLVLVPTCYNVMDVYVDKMLFTTYEDGISVESFEVSHGTKKSFFDKIFGGK